ncbi:C-4 methylsterol oxidase, putative [Penicillium digitatum PHI26]|uniref:C-4 methylsterol oxidase, putative n=2 Tax=Penicillium digitatum TaxID=36651 RepID=K9H1P7_PEND2|nr:C-4 methylsterol oxidase, putative [Penicillium digitatum Pd1]EKV19066.1 C-4 methylsterol oxidase, putative [Penicillium digitatum PHI26]EKV21076.1 C-4 methylsterol oxidase, putative [Penicillium digitatum Pd1]
MSDRKLPTGLSGESSTTSSSVFFLSLLMRENPFYDTHRILHIPSLYTCVRTQHQRFIATIVRAAQFVHPIEHLLAATVAGEAI